MKILSFIALINIVQAKKYVTNLTTKNFKTQLENHKFSLVKFYAPWCGHCKALAPTWENVAKTIEEGKEKEPLYNETMIGHINCDDKSNEEICRQYEIKGYPTVISFLGDQEVGSEGIPREEKDLIFYIHRLQDGKYKTKKETLLEKSKGPKSENPYPRTHLPGLVHKITYKDFKKMVIDSKKNVLIKFYAPWCKHCQNMAEDYENLADMWADRYDEVIIAEFNAQENQVPQGYQITGYPTLYWAGVEPENGKVRPVKYEGSGFTLGQLNNFLITKLPQVDESEEEIEEEEDPNFHHEVTHHNHPEGIPDDAFGGDAFRRKKKPKKGETKNSNNHARDEL